jgi:hypothetical protein
MSELQPIIPREENQHGNPTIPPQDTPEPVPITEQEVGEYREQDRFLPVSFLESKGLEDINGGAFHFILSDCQRIKNYEGYCTAYS